MKMMHSFGQWAEKAYLINGVWVRVQRDRSLQSRRETGIIIKKMTGNIDDCMVNQIPERRNVTEPASIKFGTKSKV